MFLSEDDSVRHPLLNEHGPWLLAMVVVVVLVVPGLRLHAMEDILSLSVFPRSVDKISDFC